jgi:hypothetical protein
MKRWRFLLSLLSPLERRRDFQLRNRRGHQEANHGATLGEFFICHLVPAIRTVFFPFPINFGVL